MAMAATTLRLWRCRTTPATGPMRGDNYRKYGKKFVPPNAKGGGAEGSRTPDLYNAIVALSQLSYGPILPSGDKRRR